MKYSDAGKTLLSDQPCQMCGVESTVDEKALSHTCYRCSIQRATNFTTMPMIVSEIGDCKECGQQTHQLLRVMNQEKTQITESFVCSDCHEVKEVVDAKNLPKSNRPAGWRFMKEFVDEDGTVYHTGEEMPDLKGTLPPTNVEKIKAQQKEKRKLKKQHKAEKLAKKQEKLAAEYEKKKRMKEKEEAKKAEEAVKNKFLEE